MGNADGTVIIKIDADSRPFEEKIEDLKNGNGIKDITEDITVDTEEISDNIKDIDDNVKGISSRSSILQKIITKISSKMIGIGKVGASLLIDVTKFIVSLGVIGGVIALIVVAIAGIAGAFKDLIEKDEAMKKDWEELKLTLQYLWFALKQAFSGVAEALLKAVKWVVQALKDIILFIARIIYLITGYNIFKSSGIEEFKKSLAGANKNAKELKKTLAGFDEMNVLNEDGSANQIGSRAIDFGGLEDLSKQVEDGSFKIKDNWKKIAGIIGGIFVLSQVKKWIKGLGLLMGSSGLGGVLGLIGQIALIGAGVAITFYITDKIWQEADELKKEIDEIAKKSDQAQKKWIENEKDINKLLETGNVNRSAGYELLKKTGGVWDWINGLGRSNLNMAKQVTINIGRQIDKEVELYKQKKLNNEEAEKVKQNIIAQYEYNQKIIKALQASGQETWQIEALNEHLIENYKDMGGEVEEVKNELGEVNQIKFDDKSIDVIVNADTSKYEENIKRAMQYAKKLAGSLGMFITAGGGGSWGGGGSGGGYRAKGGIYYPQLTPLALGGIVNSPGRGIPYHGARIAERGAEAVLPLTDSQQMSLLGAEIGRNVNIVATVPVYVGNRQIAREIQKINAENDFAYNK